MGNIDKISVKGSIYNIVSPTVFGDYIETMGGACTKPNGYKKDAVFLAKDNDVQFLYQATQNIAFGANIVEDTNCVRTTLEEVLKNSGGGGGASSADQVSYDNETSQLAADNVQEAIDEVVENVSSLNQTLANNVSDINTALGNEVATRAKLGGHNLLPYPYTNGTKTEEGITWTPQADGSVLVNGTATADSYYRFVYDEAIPNLKVGDSYTFSISGSNSVELIVAYLDSSSVEHTLGVVTSEATYTIPNDYVKARLVAKVYSGTTISNATIYPMFRLATDADPTYQPYAMTNQELTPIAQAVSNRNLLDNPWFEINQRNVSTGWNTQFSFGPDRWRKASNTSKTLVVSDNGISEANGDTFSVYSILDLARDAIKKIFGKTITASVLYSDGVIESGTLTLQASDYKPSSTIVRYFIRQQDQKSHTDFLQIENYTNSSNFVIGVRAGYTVKAVKLELGEVSTLAMDTAPNYAEELLKCQRYFERTRWFSWVTTARSNGILQIGCCYKFNVPKRTAPTFSISGAGIGNGVLQDLTAGTNIPGAEVVINQPEAFNDSMFQAKISHSSIVNGNTYFFALGDWCIDISADL